MIWSDGSKIVLIIYMIYWYWICETQKTKDDDTKTFWDHKFWNWNWFQINDDLPFQYFNEMAKNKCKISRCVRRIFSRIHNIFSGLFFFKPILYPLYGVLLAATYLSLQMKRSVTLLTTQMWKIWWMIKCSLKFFLVLLKVWKEDIDKYIEGIWQLKFY
jgi:hypothetical protein